MDKAELSRVLEDHKKWLEDASTGSRADLGSAKLRNASLVGANLREANLRDADLKDANLECANLEDANLEGANLEDANLEGADLRDANLEDANLRDAYLKGAKLRNANLRGTNLETANLRDANLEGANIDFSSLTLWCGSLKVHMDDRQVIQLLYHVLSIVNYSKNVSEGLKESLLTETNISLANQFHRVAECGRLTTIERADTVDG